MNFNNINVTELELYTVNDGHIYRSYTSYYINSLRKKALKGNYDKEKALVGYMRIVNTGAKKYARDFCSKPSEWNKVFTVEDRKEVAKRLEEYYKDCVFED